MNWIYNNKEIEKIEDLPENTFGFIYEITYNNGYKYLGSKYLYHNRTLKPLKGKKRNRKSIVESDWKTYNGSIKNEEVVEKLKIGELYPIEKKIIQICNTKKQISYYEVKYLFLYNCLELDNYYNNNILGKYFKRDLINK